MKSPRIFLILATGYSGQIGLGGGLPWNVPSDLKLFKKLTEGHAVIMGRNTFLSIGKPLPKRENIVVSRSVRYLPGVKVAPTLKDAIARMETPGPAYVIGGVDLWSEALPLASEVCMSMIDYHGDADISLPQSFFDTVRENFTLQEAIPYEGFFFYRWQRKTAA